MERLIQQIAAAMNMRSLYPTHHPRVNEAVEKLIAALNDVTEERGSDSVTILVVADDLVIENEVQRKTSLPQKQLLEILKRRGVGRLTLARGLDSAEADRFVNSLAAGEKLESTPHVILGRVQVKMEDEEGSAAEDKVIITPDQLEGARDTFGQVRRGGRMPLGELERLVWSFIDGLSSTTRDILPLAKLKNHDEATFVHCINVCQLVLAQARSFGIQGSLLHTVGMAALLHDIGKLMVPMEVLNRPGKLDDAQWAVMQGHTERGAWYLSEIEGSSPLAILVAYEHHLRVDGKPNYPVLRTPRLPNLVSRMTAIADAYDAMSTLRPYHGPREQAEAIATLKQRAGTYYDPLLVANFARLVAAA